ncbi:hypothetical protein C8R43DRAFT_949990 [Mycena crocata]|nr:hypothetical protein C8R43DRAFT_949990 [Mycena crocata]
MPKKNVWKPIPVPKTATEIVGRTKEEKKQRELERKRQQKERRETRRELEISTATFTSTAVDTDDISLAPIPVPSAPSLTSTTVIDTNIPFYMTTSAQSPVAVAHPETTSAPLSTLSYDYSNYSPGNLPAALSHLDPPYLEAQSAHVLPAARSSVSPSVHAPGTSTFAIPSLPSWIFDSLAESFDDRERAFAAANRDEGILAELLTLALQVGWAVGWQTGRSEGIATGKEERTPEERVPAEAGIPVTSPVSRQFADTDIQTDTTARVVLPQELPSPTVSPEAPIFPLDVPIPRDFSALQTGSTRPFGTLQRRLARSRRSVHHAQKKSNSVPIHPIIMRRHPFGISHSKPATTTRIHPPNGRLHTLDWDRDPLLSELGRALGALGWFRHVG